MSNEWLNDVGQLLKAKSGKLYIKFDKDFTVKKGDNITLKKKSDEINESFEAGKISEEKRDELLDKLSFVKYTLHKPPSSNS